MGVRNVLLGFVADVFDQQLQVNQSGVGDLGVGEVQRLELQSALSDAPARRR